MRRSLGIRGSLGIAAMVCSALVSAACSSGSTANEQQSPVPGTQSGTALPSPYASQARDVAATDFSPAIFDAESTVIDNKWLPFKPGSRWTFVGSANGDESGPRLSRRVVLTITDLTKSVAGVTAVVARELDFDNGALSEAELAFFAQDTSGNIWHLGQYPEEYEGGKVVAAPTWIAGLKGAKAGILMRSNPRTGTPDYSEGYAPPPINWVDHAHIYKTGQRVCVPGRCYDDVMEIQEYETGKPRAFQHKYYAPNVGSIKVGWSGANDDEHETLALTKFERLDAGQLAVARADALELEARAYQRSKDVYALTARSQ